MRIYFQANVNVMFFKRCIIFMILGRREITFLQQPLLKLNSSDLCSTQFNQNDTK
jgi:hypothetical protein